MPLSEAERRAVDVPLTALSETAVKFGDALHRVLELHAPYGIYDECDHEHTEDEADDPHSDVRYVDEVGYVCSAGLMYEVCQECCVSEGFGQREDCADRHDHDKGKPRCPTVEALGEDLTDD